MVCEGVHCQDFYEGMNDEFREVGAWTKSREGYYSRVLTYENLDKGWRVESQWFEPLTYISEERRS